jgi:two-component system response regulator HydG
MRIERITGARAAAPMVLVVDDDPGILRLLEAWLTALGHAVRTATNAFEAVAVLRGEVVGAMICDIHMPWYDGNWLIEEVADAHPRLPIIVVTGFPEKDVRVTQRPNVVRCLHKPFTRDAFAEAVERAFTMERLATNAVRLHDDRGESPRKA